LIANISGSEQDIVNQKTALETAITPLRVYTKFGWTLVHKWQKIGPECRPIQTTISDAISPGLRGAGVAL